MIGGGMTVGPGMAGGMRIPRGMTKVSHSMKEIAVAGCVDCMTVAGPGVVAGSVGCSPIVTGMVIIGGGMPIVV